MYCRIRSILDDVIRGVNAGNPAEKSAASSRFSFDIQLYIAVSVATGLFGSIRSLCFSLVGSKISNDVRNQLYTSILRQDVAFFDSITSGELTSRLARDTEGMVSPMQVRRHNTRREPDAVDKRPAAMTHCSRTSFVHSRPAPLLHCDVLYFCCLVRVCSLRAYPTSCYCFHAAQIRQPRSDDGTPPFHVHCVLTWLPAMLLSACAGAAAC